MGKIRKTEEKKLKVKNKTKFGAFPSNWSLYT